MKIYFLFIPSLILSFFFSSTSNGFNQSNGLPLNSTYYKDKIAILSFELDDFSNTELIKSKASIKIIEFSSSGFDAVIIKAKYLTKLLLSDHAAKTGTLRSVQVICEIASKAGLQILIDVDFEELSITNISASQIASIKSQIYNLVKNCELDGLIFSNINFSSKEVASLFEDIIVEAMLLKPFLIISTSSKISETYNIDVKRFLDLGIIDFVIDENEGNSIKRIDKIANKDERILKTYVKRITPNCFISLNLKEIVDKDIEQVELVQLKQVKTIDSNSKISFIQTIKSDSVKLKLGNSIYNISKSDWVIPYNYLLNKNKTVSRNGLWVEFRRPFAKVTNTDTYSLLCRGNYPSSASINGEDVKMYKTGVFFNKIKLTEGLNKIKGQVKDTKGNIATYEDRVLYVKTDAAKADSALVIFDYEIEPAENLSLLHQDYLTVSFNGSKMQKGVVEIIPSGILFDCSRVDLNNYSKYKVQIPLKGFEANVKYGIKIILKSADGKSNLAPAQQVLKHGFTINEFDNFPLLKTISDNSLLTLTLAPIRLGAPLRNELPKNVILKSNGIFGEYYRVRLSDTDEGYISKEYVEEITSPSVVPSYFINPIVSSKTDNYDVVKIPYLENVPFDVYPEPEQNRITINLYGVKTSSTWIIHRNKLRFIEEITWQQTSKETYKIYVNLKSSKIWGYDIKPNGKELVFRIKYPPTYTLKTKLPLKGIKISIEAGHGGSNSGAVSISGIKEKDINLKLSIMLEKLFKKNGAEVFQVRDSDKDMLLGKKREDAINSGANIHLSIHANSSEPEDEFLGTSGTCTFYHNPFWAKLAESIYYKLVELDLKPFGSVGSFNYKVTRMSEIPSILVEQAFMSHAEDDEKLSDDSFRMKMVHKIFEGVIDYLKYMKE